jgi:hypothetical protein
MEANRGKEKKKKKVGMEIDYLCTQISSHVCVGISHTKSNSRNSYKLDGITSFRWEIPNNDPDRG